MIIYTYIYTYRERECYTIVYTHFVPVFFFITPLSHSFSRNVLVLYKKMFHSSISINYIIHKIKLYI